MNLSTSQLSRCRWIQQTNGLIQSVDGGGWFLYFTTLGTSSERFTVAQGLSFHKSTTASPARTMVFTAATRRQSLHHVDEIACIFLLLSVLRPRSSSQPKSLAWRTCSVTRANCQFFVIARSETKKQTLRLKAEIVSPAFRRGRSDNLSPVVTE